MNSSAIDIVSVDDSRERLQRLSGVAQRLLEQARAAERKLAEKRIKDALLQNRLCGEVLGCANGEQLLQTMAGSLGRRPAVSLVILDVEMPILNGYQAAIALRAFERGFGLPPTPIVFFSSLALNETFTKVIEYVHPARYLAKGTDSAAQMALRLAQALGTLTSS